MINYAAFDQKHPLKARLSRGWKIFIFTRKMYKPLILIMIIIMIIMIVPLLIIFLSILFFIPLILISFLLNFGQTSILLAPAFDLVNLAILSFVLFVTGVILYGIAKDGKRALQIEQFCKDNNFSFQPFRNSDGKTGSIFNRGDYRAISEEISGTVGGNAFCLYNYRSLTVGGPRHLSYNFSVAEITLKRKFPHILLDNKKDSSISGFKFDKSQRLELEGDFNDYFSVYGPKEYEIEVLQVLNPSVMMALLDIKESFDIEIIGNKIFIYKEGKITKKQTLQTIFSAIKQLSSSIQGVRTTFTMPEQIGDYKPILKRYT